jgi:DNA-binding transcriptional LysR family regulator
MLEWDDLRYLRTIARVGTLAGAARELGVEHSTVGRRLSALETALGTRLFTRGSMGLVPTAACNEILPNLEAIAGEIEALELRLSGGDARLEGTVRLTVPELLGPYMVRQLSAFRDRHASIRVEVLSGDKRFDLARGEADLAIRAGEVADADLVVRRLSEVGVSVFASSTYLERRGAPASLDDLGGHDVIAFDANLATYPGAAWLDAHLAGAVVVMRGHTIPAIHKAAVEGLGLALLPCLASSDDPRLRRVTARVLGTRSLNLVVHPGSARMARIRAVMDFLVEIFTRDQALFSGR